MVWYGKYDNRTDEEWTQNPSKKIEEEKPEKTKRPKGTMKAIKKKTKIERG